jgi:hypothetical protein
MSFIPLSRSDRVVTGALTFSANQATQLYKTFYWHDDLKVLDLTEALLDTGSLKVSFIE